MKLNPALALSFLAATISAIANDAMPPCPTPAAAGMPACCSAEKVTAAKPLSGRSIYQLGATWTNDAGNSVTLSSLRGKPVILAMFFAQCEYACPAIVQDMKRLRAALPETVRDQAQLVLVSFDTERDTPEALRSFRERMVLDQHWTLLRGDTEAVQELAMLLGMKFKQDARGQFAHSNLLTLMNAEGEIVHRRGGLNGDISEAARVFAVTAK
jgi:protein SCO1/2